MPQDTMSDGVPYTAARMKSTNGIKDVKYHPYESRNNQRPFLTCKVTLLRSDTRKGARTETIMFRIGNATGTGNENMPILAHETLIAVVNAEFKRVRSEERGIRREDDGSNGELIKQKGGSPRYYGIKLIFSRNFIKIR